METAVAESRKRPVWVWVISTFFFFSAANTFLSFCLIYSGKIPLQPEQKAYFDSLTVMDMGLAALLGLTNLTAAVFLLFLRKQAFYLFAATLGFNLLITLWHIVSKDFIAAMPAGGLIGMAIALGIQIAVCIYTGKLVKAGVLR